MACSTSVVSMHSPVTGETGPSWEDRLARPAEEGPEAIAMDADRARTAREALQALSPRQRRVVTLRYGGSGNHDEPTPLRDVARVMGLSRERVRQIEIERARSGAPQARSRREEALARFARVQSLNCCMAWSRQGQRGGAFLCAGRSMACPGPRSRESNGGGGGKCAYGSRDGYGAPALTGRPWISR